MSIRQPVIKAHIAFASLFLPFMLLMPITGGLYLAGVSGDVTKEPAFTVIEQIPEGALAKEQFFRDQFKKQNLDYSFEYIRESGNDFNFRPFSKVYYVATKSDADITFYRVRPTILRRLVEIHKGHGPVLMKWVEGAFAVMLILTSLTGLWLGLTVPAYRRWTISAFIVGVVVIAAALV